MSGRNLGGERRLASSAGRESRGARLSTRGSPGPSWPPPSGWLTSGCGCASMLDLRGCAEQATRRLSERRSSRRQRPGSSTTSTTASRGRAAASSRQIDEFAAAIRAPAPREPRPGPAAPAHARDRDDLGSCCRAVSVLESAWPGRRQSGGAGLSPASVLGSDPLAALGWLGVKGLLWAWAPQVDFSRYGVRFVVPKTRARGGEVR